MAHQGVDIPFCRRRSGRGVLWRYDHVEAAPRPNKLAAPLQTLGGVEECPPADADLLLRLIRRKDPPGPGQQAGGVGGKGLIARFESYLIIRFKGGNINMSQNLNHP
jgi:hypothetical protein